ncbi:hypothetical protein LVJ83_06580 [Uruburuella testudinis]|uniref:Uncharacterized protein n=1 Tax=Uruburuella testudinis TaxID=1282863 RepID=A0ABY4DVQ2_9NEIS|nr:hypothetical protein [Uruburuella testudinis]UOO83120.1 hypothetical protein LVJ83_06580 [Uruburuella testudinis]
MKEITIRELEMVVGGMGAIPHIIRAGSVVLKSPAGKGAVVGGGVHVAENQLSGTETNISGFTGAVVGGAAGGKTHGLPGSVIGSSLLGSSLEGALNGKGPLAPEFFKNQGKDPAGNNYCDDGTDY